MKVHPIPRLIAYPRRSIFSSQGTQIIHTHTHKRVYAHAHTTLSDKRKEKRVYSRRFIKYLWKKRKGEDPKQSWSHKAGYTKRLTAQQGRNKAIGRNTRREGRGEFPSQHRQHLIHSYWGNKGLEVNRPTSRAFPHLFSLLVTDSSLSALEERGRPRGGVGWNKMDLSRSPLSPFCLQQLSSYPPRKRAEEKLVSAAEIQLEMGSLPWRLCLGRSWLYRKDVLRSFSLLWAKGELLVDTQTRNRGKTCSDAGWWKRGLTHNRQEMFLIIQETSAGIPFLRSRPHRRSPVSSLPRLPPVKAFIQQLGYNISWPRADLDHVPIPGKRSGYRKADGQCKASAGRCQTASVCLCAQASSSTVTAEREKNTNSPSAPFSSSWTRISPLWSICASPPGWIPATASTPEAGKRSRRKLGLNHGVVDPLHSKWPNERGAESQDYFSASKFHDYPSKTLV